MKKLATLGASVICFTVSIDAQSQISAAQKEALNEIRDFARSLCTSVGASGRASEWRASAEGRAQVTGVVKRFADLGFKGATEISDKKWEGVLQADLASVLTGDAQCRLKVFEKLEAKLLSSATSPPDGPKSTACNVLAQDQVCMGMSRGSFKANPQRSAAEWETEGQYLTTTMEYHAHGLKGRAWFYFSNERLVQIIFESTARSWSSDLHQNIFAGATASLKPNWKSEKESSGGDSTQVSNFCASLTNFQRSFNDKYGPPTRKPTIERTSIQGLMQGSNDYCKGDKCEIHESDKTVQKSTYSVSPGVLVELSSIATQAAWNRYIGYDRKLDMRTRNECTLSFKYMLS